MPYYHNQTMCPLQYEFRRLLLCFTLSLLPALATADDAQVAKLIESPAPGIQSPVVWFRSDPGVNSGTGSPSLLATSGGTLGDRTANPWGQADAAFGPSGEPLTGAAVAGSKEANLLSSENGTVLLFLKAPETPDEESIIFEQGAWSQETQCFDLRIRKGKSLEILVGAPGMESPPQGFPLSDIEAGQWYFLALSWQKETDDYAVKWWVGELAAGATPMQGDLRLPAMGAPGSALKIAGRARGETFGAPVVLAGGYLNNFAVYDSRLGDDQISAIYSAALEGLK
jgi:hypothetical protein